MTTWIMGGKDGGIAVAADGTLEFRWSDPKRQAAAEARRKVDAVASPATAPQAVTQTFQELVAEAMERAPGGAFVVRGGS